MTRDRGSGTVLMAGVVALVAVISVATAGLGLAYSARAQAQAAADAAALAAAVATYPAASVGAPITQARRAAAANGAMLASCSCRLDPSLHVRVVEVVTTLRVDVPVFGRLEVKAGSRAEFDPQLWLGR